MTALLPIVVGVAAWVPLLLAEFASWPRVRMVAKLTASAAFVVGAIVSGALGAGRPGMAIFVGLLLSFVGDALLLSRATVFFLSGIGAFLLAHLAYIFGFLSLGFEPVGAVWALAPILALVIGVGRWILPRAGKLAPAVGVYILTIGCMMLAAAAACGADPSRVRLGLVVAAVAFALSDITVARDRFVAPGFANHVVGYPLYFGAQLAIASLIARAAG